MLQLQCYTKKGHFSCQTSPSFQQFYPTQYFLNSIICPELPCPQPQSIALVPMYDCHLVPPSSHITPTVHFYRTHSVTCLLQNIINSKTLTMLHHHSEKPDDDFGARPNKNLAFASLFGIVDTLESISQDIHAHHYGCSGKTKQGFYWHCH